MVKKSSKERRITMNKLQEIKDWISKEQDGLMDAQGNFDNPSDEGAFHILTNLDYYIDSLQEEPVSEDLEEAANDYAHDIVHDDVFETFKAGARWQKQQMMKDAVDAECDVILLEEGDELQYSVLYPIGKRPYNKGDKVKVIIIKEE